MTDTIRPHYSGQASKRFWAEVGKLPPAKRKAPYALGVALQNLEHQTLKALRDAQADTDILGTEGTTTYAQGAGTNRTY